MIYDSFSACSKITNHWIGIDSDFDGNNELHGFITFEFVIHQAF